jgi:hypothetical protein
MASKQVPSMLFPEQGGDSGFGVVYMFRCLVRG